MNELKMFFVALFLLYNFSVSSQEVVVNIPPKVSTAIEDKLLVKIKAMHDPANAAMFSRAFVGSVWKYELVKKPAGRDLFYLFVLREYRGSFVIDQYKVKVFEKDNVVLVEDWVSNKFVSVDDWLRLYSDVKNKK
ncbi:MAG: hypothetical protein J0M08_01825 [Bacteroidetes bacterium]|nr:hypothetical protein [Bacteroidota bacterium]